MTETVYTMPLTNVPQRFNMDIVGVTYTILCRWNESIGWSLDISNAADDTPLIACLPLVTGTDLLGQYAYLGIGAALIAYTDGDQFAPPTLQNLGRESNLYLLVES
jgi:hypothetical protein